MTFPKLSTTAGIIPPPLYKAAPYFAFVLAVFAAYGNVYDNAFIDDDQVLIVRNAFLQDWHYLGLILTTSLTAGVNIAGGFFRPLQILLYFLIYQAVGASSFAFHLLNLALHAANACLLYRLGGKLGFNRVAAFFAALLWALHPVQVEAITYMSGTADPLYVFFCLVALLILLPDFTWRKSLIAAPLLLLGLLSKEEAVMFPLLGMSCVFWLDDRRFRPATYLRTWPLWLISGIYLAAHKFLLSFGDFPFYPAHLPYTSSILCRIYTFAATLPAYLGFLVWPTHLHFDRNLFPVLDPWNLPTLTGITMVVLAAVQIVLGRGRRARALSWGLLWFGAAHFLHSGILVPLNSMLAEHWLYLPSAGLFLGIGESIAPREWKWERRGIILAIIPTALALVLGVLTYEQNTIWHDDESFYLNIFRNGEPSIPAHDNLGVVYTDRGDYEKAIEQYRMSIQLSGDRDAFAEYNLAVALLLQRNDDPHILPEAIAHMQRALELDPAMYSAAEKLAILYTRTGDNAQAALYRDKADAIRNQLTHSAP